MPLVIMLPKVVASPHKKGGENMNHAGARKVKKKRKKRLHKEQFLFIRFTDADISYYGSDYYGSLEDALKRAKADITRIAIKEGYNPKDVFRPNINDIYRRIRERWEE